MEKIRQLAKFLQHGIEAHDSYVETLIEERTKYMRLAISNGFEDEGEQSRESWLSHLQALKNRIDVHLNAMRVSIVNDARAIESDLPSGPAPDEKEDDEPENNGDNSIKVV